jgi:hypothetical protein
MNANTSIAVVTGAGRTTGAVSKLQCNWLVMA